MCAMLKKPPRSLADLGVRGRDIVNVTIKGLSIDSRTLEEDFLFVALDGVNIHGAQFIRQAIDAGVSAILTDKTGVECAKEALKNFKGALIISEKPRATLAQIAARWFEIQADYMVGVTGTNGKTSTVHFLRQIWQYLGYRAVNVGTNGVEGDFIGSPSLTTPDAIHLHDIIAQACENGVTHLAFEASSHGLAQRRCDGIKLCAAGFSNLTRDHMDYHIDFEDYFWAKARLFTHLLPKEAPAVIMCDDDGGKKMVEVTKATGRTVITVSSTMEADLKIVSKLPTHMGQRVLLHYRGEAFQTKLGLIGAFQSNNVALAAGLAIACGALPEEVFNVLDKLEGVEGRMQLAATLANGALVFVDFAHSPDAIAVALADLRPYTLGRLGLVFGAGGERDKGKRSFMGEIAQQADFVVVTDDNPRRENPAHIRQEIRKGCPDAVEIGDRAEAILYGVSLLKGGDVLLIAGKGAEMGQNIDNVTYPFSDAEQASIAVHALEGAYAQK